MLNFEKETLLRNELSEQHKINPNYKRLRFLGEPKNYDKIVGWANELEKHPLYGGPRE